MTGRDGTIWFAGCVKQASETKQFHDSRSEWKHEEIHSQMARSSQKARKRRKRSSRAQVHCQPLSLGKWSIPSSRK